MNNYVESNGTSLQQLNYLRFLSRRNNSLNNKRTDTDFKLNLSRTIIIRNKNRVE